MTWREAFHQSPLARRLIFWTVLFSSCVTLVLTGLQLYRDYRHDVSQIEQNFAQIEAVHLATLTNSLWATDKERLQLQLDGMLQLQDMHYLEIREGDLIWARAGNNVSRNVIRREIPLHYWHNGREQVLGTLVAVATLDHVYGRLLGEALIILLSNGVKTFLVAVFMLFLIYYQVTRHLLAISRFVHQLSLVEAQPPLTLDRAPREDELRTTVMALNHMHARLKELAGASAQLRELLTNMAGGFVRLDRDWRYVFVNKRAGKLFGRTPEELLGKNIWEEFPQGVGQPFYLAYRKAMTDQQPSQIQSYFPPWDKWFENRIYPASDGLSIFFDDITERKQAEVEREKLLNELSVRNVEMEAFIYTISHDLKSPLITIGGFSTLLEKDIARGDRESTADSLGEIKKAVELMQTHIEDLLLLSRTGRVTAEQTDVPLAALLEEVIGQFGRRIAGENAQLVIAPDLPTIRVDRKGFVRVYTNLIDNALKYRCPDIAPRIEIGWRREGDELRLFVRDNGQGIKKEYLQRIFGLFQRADSSTEGTGVGLAISKRVIEVHGGRMWVESEPGKGSTFWIGLPDSVIVSEDSAAESAQNN